MTNPIKEYIDATKDRESEAKRKGSDALNEIKRVIMSESRKYIDHCLKPFSEQIIEAAGNRYGYTIVAEEFSSSTTHLTLWIDVYINKTCGFILKKSVHKSQILRAQVGLAYDMSAENIQIMKDQILDSCNSMTNEETIVRVARYLKRYKEEELLNGWEEKGIKYRYNDSVIGI